MSTPRPTLSFIIIAKNQARTIARAIDSAIAAADAAGLPERQLIYVDSCSTDRSTEIVEERFGSSVEIVRLGTEARPNAGIARNAGARVATGDTLFFIDGDMEIDPRFLPQALDRNFRPINPLVVGQLPEKFYDTDWNFLADSGDRYRFDRRQRTAEIGGVMIVSRADFEAVGGFRPELRINEDLDFGLRMAAHGAPPLALPTPIAVHHTVDYFDWSRLIRSIRDGTLLYPGALFRRHLLNRYYWPIFLSHQRSTLILLASLALGIESSAAWLLAFPAYVTAKAFRQRHVGFLQHFVGTTARSILFIAGALFFYPRRAT